MPLPPDSPPSRTDLRTTTAILAGLLVPVIALAVTSWLSPSAAARRSGSSAAALAPVASPTPAVSATPANPAPRLKVQVVASYPHDRGAFTQGLHYEEGVLFESTGLEGKSTIRRVELATGRVLQQTALAPDLFGEGIARIPLGLVQLTWKNQVGFVYAPRTLQVLRRFSYRGEGWGLCYDGTSLVMSEGTEYLKVRRPDTFEVVREVRVVEDGVPIPFLNELECVDGSVYANSWRRDFLVKIDPATGKVLERIDASGLLTDAEARGTDVLNGIAYDPADGTFLLTGKYWPKVFRVRFVPAGT